MKTIIIIFFALNIISCSNNIRSGKYIFDSDKSYIKIDKKNNYYFSTNGDLSKRYMFSQGKISRNGNVVSFIPDSSCFFRISVLKHYFNPSLKNNRKIILYCTDSIFSKLQFSFDKYSSDSAINFSSNHTVIYKPKFGYQKGYFTLKAVFKDSTIDMLPLPIHDSLISNTIEFFDVNDDDPKDTPWNVLIIKVSISGRMFAFTTLPLYIFKHRQLIKKEWPIYTLSKH